MINFSQYITGIAKLGLVKTSLFFILMLNLYILRHGKAIKTDDSGKDFNRKLNIKGIAQVNQVGYILKSEGVIIDQMIASGAQRTLETAEIMEHYLPVSDRYIDDSLYLTDYDTLLKTIVKKAKKPSLLLVGHNFGLSDFANYLTGDNRVLSTSMLVQINFNFDDWGLVSRDTGTLARIIEPDVHVF